MSSPNACLTIEPYNGAMERLSRKNWCIYLHTDLLAGSGALVSPIYMTHRDAEVFAARLSDRLGKISWSTPMGVIESEEDQLDEPDFDSDSYGPGGSNEV